MGVAMCCGRARRWQSLGDGLVAWCSCLGVATSTAASTIVFAAATVAATATAAFVFFVFGRSGRLWSTLSLSILLQLFL